MAAAAVNRCSVAADLPKKGVAVEEDEPNKDNSTDEEGNEQGSQGPAAADASGPGGNSTMLGDQDRLMPAANINRIMRKVLPTHAKIAEDTKAFVQQCVHKFMGYVTAEANERCRQEQRKTVTAEDMLYAFTKLGFHEYVEYLCVYLNRYRLAEGNHRSARRDLLAEGVRAAVASSAAAGLHPPPGLDAGAQGYPGALIFGNEGGSSSAAAAAAAAGGVMMPDEYRPVDVGGTQAGPSMQGPPPPFGFDPFGRYY
ncbi:hypothetical protein Taro_016485 [Colocasia esculenta]|uniref:Transcription factor CBF/NF-Y/archaeal histone domain-containing protein n=1 Tax=Colocasia esculenta TaxID=4460 RepID=A0A843UNN0_COLES|nr:hypothetical protein [Colocasia esculenta]